MGRQGKRGGNKIGRKGEIVGGEGGRKYGEKERVDHKQRGLGAKR